MKQDARGLFSKLISTRQFLFSKSAYHLEDHPDRLTSLPGTDPLVQAFPDVLIGEAFASAALEQMASLDQFGAIVLRIEPGGNDAEQLGRLRLDLARVLAPVCQARNGAWGVLDPLHLACVLPQEPDKANCMASARSIQETLAAKGGGKATLGVALYPTLDFERELIIENAFKALDHAEFFGPGSRVAFDAVSLNISGDKRYDAGDIEGAVEEYNKGLLLDPGNVNIRNSLGVCYGVMGEFEKALTEFKEAMQLDAREVMAVYNTGLTHTLRKEMDEGMAHLKQAETIDDGVFEVALQIGRVHFESGDLQTARQYLDKALGLKPESSAAFYYLGECCSGLNQQKAALSAYKSAIKFDPNNASALSALGWLYDQRDESRDIALIYCEQSVKIAPENGLFYFRLGRLYLKHGRLEEAMEVLQTAADLGHDVAGDLTEIRELKERRNPSS